MCEGLLGIFQPGQGALQGHDNQGNQHDMQDDTRYGSGERTGKECRPGEGGACHAGQDNPNDAPDNPSCKHGHKQV